MAPSCKSRPDEQRGMPQERDSKVPSEPQRWNQSWAPEQGFPPPPRTVPSLRQRRKNQLWRPMGAGHARPHRFLPALTPPHRLCPFYSPLLPKTPACFATERVTQRKITSTHSQDKLPDLTRQIDPSRPDYGNTTRDWKRVIVRAQVSPLHVPGFSLGIPFSGPPSRPGQVPRTRSRSGAAGLLRD